MMLVTRKGVGDLLIRMGRKLRIRTLRNWGMALNAREHESP
jgi:hypothetical protein